MRIARRIAAAAACMTFALVPAPAATADPLNAPGAETVTFTCDGVPITLTLLNGSAAFTTTTSVGISVGLVRTDVATGEELFNLQIPGFEHNVIETVTCVHEFDGVLATVTAFFTPPTP